MNKIYIPQPIIPGSIGASNKTHDRLCQGDKPNQASFAQIFQQQLDKTGLKFSAHAQKRLADRNINLDAAELQKLETALSKAQAKGAKESLVLINNRAYVISVPNKTVITAVDEHSLKENVFTNIDSAVIM
ncbi:MAG: flagellar protein [Clostridia bacterium]|jgi:flagellar operon protein|nr:flagellar protein [Clostridia bacterium]